MATLHEALQCLSATTWDSVPSDPDALRAYMNDISTKARLIVNSVPEQPPHSPSDKEHTPYPPHPSSPTAPQITPSPTRLNTDDPALQALHQEWGKPIKVSSTRDNPLDIPVYKLSGADGRGSWFGRRSIHEGLPFARWQEKLSSEMLVTLAANEERLEQGKVADQAVRGIGAERRVEQIEVRRHGGEEVMGHVNVFHVSAQFPRPTTPRDFVALILDWDTSSDGGGGGRNWMMVSRPCLHPDVPDRSGFIRGEYESVEFIREVVPGRGVEGVDGGEGGDNLASTSAGGARDRSPGEIAVGAKEGGQDPGGANEEANPVEWIMVTRSDPGGNIPRWMVEKGTPKSICSDAAKFVDWACREPDSTAGENATNNMRKSTGPSRRGSQHTAGVGGDTDSDDSDTSDLEHVEHHGLIASFAYLLNSGVERYAPQAVLDYLPQHSRHSSALSHPGSSISQHSDGAFKTPSARSTTDVNDTTATTAAADAKSQASQSKASSSASATSGLVTPILEAGDHNIPPAELMKTDKKGKMSSHEKQLVKLAQQKRDVEDQLDRVRADIQSLNTNAAAAAATPPPRDEVPFKRDKASTAALAAAGGGDAVTSDQASSSAASTMPPARPPSSQSETKSKKDGKSKKKDKKDKKDTNSEEVRVKKVAPKLFHDESKLLKQLGKIEKHQMKEASKVEARLKKDAANEEKSRSRTENDYLRHENDHLKREIDRLRGERKQWLDLIGTLQDDNSQLAKRRSGDKSRD